MPSKVAIIGGGSSTFVPQLMRLFLASEALRGSTIALMDVDAHRLEVMERLCRALVKLERSDLVVESTTDQRAALDGADFVITAISVGGMDAWEKDIEIPAKHGIYMPIADSIGPGGIMRAFRHIPVLASVAEDLEELSPEAWVFNYSNPATSNTMAMRMVSSVNSIGLCTCSSIPRQGTHLASMVGLEPDDLLTPAPCAGLNHCSAILELRLKDGTDALPLFAEKAEGITKWGLETYGILPYCWSHWAEFYPQLLRLEEPYEGRLQGLKMAYGLTAHDMNHERERSVHWEQLVERLGSGKERLSLDVLPKDEAIEVVGIIEAKLGNTNELYVVNVPNNGAVANLPADAIVEVPAVINAYGATPIQVGEIPEGWASVLRTHVTVQQMTAEAALEGDADMALDAFLHDPNVVNRLTPAEAETLLDEMLDAHEEYMPF